MTDPRPVSVENRLEANGELSNRVQQLRLDTQLGAAKKGGGGSAWLPWVLCILLAGSWAFVAIRWYRAPRDDSAAAASTGTTGSTAGGTNSTPSAPESTVQVEVKGYLMPARQIAVSPIDVAGRIIELYVVEGKLYQEGTVLARIDPSSFKAIVGESQATLLGAERRLDASRQRLAELKPQSVRQVEIRQITAQLNEAKAQRARASDEHDRLRNLTGISGRELNQAFNELEAAKARVIKLEADLEILTIGPRPERIAGAEADVRAAEADVTAAAARLAQARWRLDNCEIKAPITGTVLIKKAEKGNLVNPLAFAATSGSVCDMADLTDLEVDLKVAEREIGKIKVGQTCRIRPDAYADRTYTGRLDRIMPIANRADNTVNVRVKVTLPEGEVPGTYLKPEMGAIVTFLEATK
jgi:multidrug resistance efflux pump